MLRAVNSDFQLGFMWIHKTGFPPANSLRRDLKDAGAGEAIQVEEEKRGSQT